MKDDVKFYVRILEKNPGRGDLEPIKIASNKKTLFVKTLKQVGFRPKDLYWQFNTDGIFLTSNQKEIFSKLVQIDLSSVLKGADLVIIAFGQINSGKSYTISAPYEKHSERGIIPRLIEAIFSMKKDVGTHGADINCKMSFVEFFHDKCYDLLSAGPVQINHSTMAPTTISSIEDAIGKFLKGETRRKFERASNHCGASVLTLYIEAKCRMQRSANINFSKVHVVDFPGTELIDSSPKGKCQTCKISACLNKFNFDRAAKWSSTLNEVLKSRSRQPCPPVFNCSNFISFLGRSLTNGMVRLIGHVVAGKEHAVLTLSTLRFGCKMAKYLFSQVIYNAKPELTNVAEVLQDEVSRLENEAHQNSLIRTGGEYKSNNVFQGEIQHIERLIALYLSDKNFGRMTENILLSTAHPWLVFREIRNRYQKDLEKLLNQEDETVTDEITIISPRSSLLKNQMETPRMLNEGTPQAPPPPPPPSSVDSAPSHEEKSKAEPSPTTGGGGKRKSVARKSLKRKSIARKSKVGQSGRGGGGGGTGGRLKVTGKPEVPEIPPEFNRKMLDYGLKNKKWFFDEFLKRNDEVNRQLNELKGNFTIARDEKDNAFRSLVRERKNLAEATYGAEEAACKQSAGGGATDVAKEQECLAQIDTIKTKLVEAITEMARTHEVYMNAIKAQEQFLKETAEPKFNEFVQQLETSLAEVVIVRADAKDLPLFKADTFRSLRLENKTDKRTASEIQFEGLQKKHGVKKTGTAVLKAVK